MTTHYSLALSPKELTRWADKASHQLHSLYKANRNSTKAQLVLCYTGLSGIGHGTALALTLTKHYPKTKINCLYVRKGSERSHGGDIECFSRFDVQDYFVFVDDFIDAGNTVKRVTRKLRIDLKEDGFLFDAACFIRNIMYREAATNLIDKCFYNEKGILLV